MKIAKDSSCFAARSENITGSCRMIMQTLVALTILVACMLTGNSSFALTVNVVDGNNNPIAGGFRWQIEQDTTKVTVPGAKVADSVSLTINRSYCPVVTNGHATNASTVIPVPSSDRYVVSVLPDAGYTLSAATVTNGQSTVTVTVNTTPVPTAQVT
ncbi:MAG: hypothetical protein WCN95_11865, partial [bacterium]